mmetsp:Transcript_5333/g.10039  ORF Transcript_5333/g.10039 Transcript_5333/m.10039 type:complete len:202 (-) Transcript_5333:83-688(-)
MSSMSDLVLLASFLNKSSHAVRHGLPKWSSQPSPEEGELAQAPPSMCDSWFETLPKTPLPPRASISILASLEDVANLSKSTSTIPSSSPSQKRCNNESSSCSQTASPTESEAGRVSGPVWTSTGVLVAMADSKPSSRSDTWTHSATGSPLMKSSCELSGLLARSGPSAVVVRVSRSLSNIAKSSSLSSGDRRPGFMCKTLL